MEEKTTKILGIIDDILAENENGITEEHRSRLAGLVTDQNELADLLPELKKKYNEYLRMTERCEKAAKDYTDSKKMWKSRGDQIIALLGAILKGLKLKSYATSDTKVTLSTREVLEADSDALMSPYVGSFEYQALQQALPSYIKISLAVDKTALKSHIKADSSLLTNHPEWVHTRENESVTLK